MHQGRGGIGSHKHGPVGLTTQQREQIRNELQELQRLRGEEAKRTREKGSGNK